jgi:hypothetical protein
MSLGAFGSMERIEAQALRVVVGALACFVKRQPKNSRIYCVVKGLREWKRNVLLWRGRQRAKVVPLQRSIVCSKRKECKASKLTRRGCNAKWERVDVGQRDRLKGKVWCGRV